MFSGFGGLWKGGGGGTNPEQSNDIRVTVRCVGECDPAPGTHLA